MEVEKEADEEEEADLTARFLEERAREEDVLVFFLVALVVEGAPEAATTEKPVALADDEDADEDEEEDEVELAIVVPCLSVDSGTVVGTFVVPFCSGTTIGALIEPADRSAR